ncbi:dUTPase-like protein [Bipolaris maydis]|uniref:dUTPase-like protein n=1 Tax=Cochliobolus heterostrophus TaxID=5016 RepID=UPI0024D168C4|nr:dUTPase-like protein [Bipolaris maydis]
MNKTTTDGDAPRLPPRTPPKKRVQPPPPPFSPPLQTTTIATAIPTNNTTRQQHSTPTSMSDTPLPPHSPPSLPASPLPKRTKVISPSPLTQPSTLPRGTDSGLATPTPLASMSSVLQPPAPIAPSIAAGAAAEQQLQVQLLSANARAPTKGSAFAAGHDLYSAVDVVIPARGRKLVATDIKISVPVGTYGRVAPRSGLAYKHGIDTMAGVIDADYRGPVGVILANLSDEDFEIKIGDRIAQLVVEKIAMPNVVVVEELEQSVRGSAAGGGGGGGD